MTESHRKHTPHSRLFKDTRLVLVVQRHQTDGPIMYGEADLALCDGARVHLDAVRGVNCVIAYGQKWRGAAVTALRALGLDAPRGFTLL
jgi:hypothetical protein